MSSPVETEYRLNVRATGVIDSSGNATSSTVGPTQAGERWKLEIMSAGGSAVAKLEVFRNGRKVDGTDRADNDTSPTDIELRLGEVLVFQWTRGTVGANMYVDIAGTRLVRGRRAY